MQRTALLVGLLAGCWAGAQAPNLGQLDVVEQTVPDGPVAFVEGTPVSREDYLFLYQTNLAMAAMQIGPKNVNDEVRVRAGVRCLAELAQREILWHEARRRGIKVGDAEVSEEYQKRLKMLQEQMTEEGKPSPGEADILARSGLSRGQTMDNVRKVLLVSRVSEAIAKEKGAQVSDAEVEQFYRERPELFERPGGLHLKQIYTRPKPPVNDASWEAARKAMEKAVARIQTGESFEAVVKSMSDAPDRERGGDMGPIPAEQLPPFYVEAAGKLQAGGMSDILKSEHGYHVIKLVSKEAAGTVTLAEARERIREVLLENKQEEILEAFCQPILQDAERVKIYLKLDRKLDEILSKEAQKAKKDGTSGAAAPKAKESPEPKKQSAPKNSSEAKKKR